MGTLIVTFLNYEAEMIITVVCDVYGKENNGTVIAAKNLINSLKEKGHTVRVLCADKASAGQEGFYICPTYNFGKLINNYVKKVGVELAKPVKDIIIKALDSVDCVHIMVPLALGLATMKVAREKNLPVTAGFHMQAQNLTWYFKLNNFKVANRLVYKYIYKHLYRYVDAIHYPTQFIRDKFESNIKHETPGYVISNGVHEYVKRRVTPRPAEWGDKYVILSTGRYAREKCQDTLIKAIKYSKYKDDLLVVLGGTGPKEKYYRKLASKVPGHVIFNFFSRTEIIDVLNACDMYVHPAQFELEGISCTEAITCGKLTIVSDSDESATKGFAVNKNCIFKCRNPKDLARVIDYWIEHKEEAKVVADEYLNSAKSFNQAECMDKMEQMILDAIKKHNTKDDK